ncbi:4Fe-4S binding protein [Prosthecomicrobium sp. N25]|uniref:4Fe-4S binding protein n=1 Tax=Prosthecomicrobium sp. N25 TaxID=3129254 RepID=UPI003077565A
MPLPRPIVLLLALLALLIGVAGAGPALAEARLADFLAALEASELVPGAEGFGTQRQDLRVTPVLKGGETVAWAFLTSDFVPTTGYSGKPIHVVAAVDKDAVVRGVKLVKHSEPIVLIGIPDARIREVTAKYAGLDLRKEARGTGLAHELDIVSGATVTIMVIDDSIVRAGLKVARALKLGGLSDGRADTGPKPAIDAGRLEIRDFEALVGDGSLKRLTVDVGQINEAFARIGDPRNEAHVEPGPAEDAYVDLYVGLADVPSIGRSLLGEAEWANLKARLKDGEHALFVAGRGRYSYKGSGYVRGGIFDRITLVQGDRSVRFRDKQQRRVGEVAAAGAPAFPEADLFIIPREAGFEPGAPFRLQLLVQRAVGPVDKIFLTYDLGYQLPARWLALPPAAPAASQPAAATNRPEGDTVEHLWARIWADKKTEVSILAGGILLLTGIFFFQAQATRNERLFNALRTGFLLYTLVFIGFWANAQLSVVNVLAFVNAATSGFRWDTFLMDPLVFTLWFSVAAALLFWGRGAYCGWLCPFGALQELTNKLARRLGVPQVKLPWGLHERLWPLKYMIFLGLFGLSLYSLDVAEHYAEVEPFKTAIILKFVRAWPFVLFAVLLLVAGLFIERFYCRYLCPLGAALAIPARLHMFRWLKRYRECGSPCQVCAKDCPVEAIHPTGEINPNECISCLNCQVLYQHTAKCPVVVQRMKKRQRFEEQTGLKPPSPTPSKVPAKAPAPAE